MNKHGPALVTIYSNPCKTWLLVKQEIQRKASVVFKSTDVFIISDGRNILGCPITESFTVSQASSKIENLILRLLNSVLFQILLRISLICSTLL